jgi:hypothetical protein
MRRVVSLITLCLITPCLLAVGPLALGPLARGPLALGIGIAPSAQAVPVVEAAALGCHGSSCNGRNPQTQGCSRDAVTLASRDWFDGAAGSSATITVELRYSTKCRASWSRVRANGVGTVAVTKASAWVKGHKSATIRSRAGSGSVYSLMRSGSDHAAEAWVSFNHGAVVQTLAVHQ